MSDSTLRALFAFLIVFEIIYSAGLITGYAIITNEYGAGHFNSENESWYEHKRGKDIINGLIAFAVLSLLLVTFNIVIICTYGCIGPDTNVIANITIIALMCSIYTMTMWPIGISDDFPYYFIIGAYGVNAFIALCSGITLIVISIKKQS